eukprot:TRINITY_DN1676_c0_g4_i2.p1 TRINITY_DN1676_c0_g4~~TRINITY_DN1676_c0_g4_i2.p1  ORF type:complete len:377 (+),score=86.29 TRINITY_DN1676_c0_g4_i2:50-1132(+)
MADVPAEDGITTRIDEQGRNVKVERSTKHSETESEKEEVITVITTTDEPKETRVVTLVITITWDKLKGSKTTKRKKSTSVVKKEEHDEEEEFLITPDGVSEYVDRDSGFVGTREQRTTVQETEEEIITIVKVVTTTVIPGPLEETEKVVTLTTTTTKKKSTGVTTTVRNTHTGIRKKKVRRVNVRLATVLGESNFKRTRLIFGVDFTKSNIWNGRNTFNGSLHTVGKGENPYQRVLRVVGEALEGYSVDKKIPTFGFGDKRTHARDTFPFLPDCVGGKDYDLILEQYKEIVKFVELSGPTSWAPIIRKAIEVTKSNQGHHTLVLITDDPADESKVMDTRRAVEEANQVPLSIIVVGVGEL